MSFGVGDLVVCVDDGERAGLSSAPPFVTKGTIYTIRELYTGMFGGDFVRLEELIGPMGFWGYELGFLADRFRPVKRHSIEIFRALCVSPDLEGDVQRPRRKVTAESVQE